MSLEKHRIIKRPFTLVDTIDKVINKNSLKKTKPTTPHIQILKNVNPIDIIVVNELSF